MALSADGKLLFVLNNPPDPNGVTPDEGRDPRARIEFALVELEAGAAALPENTATFKEPDATPDEENQTPTPNSSAASLTNELRDKDDNQMLCTVLIVVATVIVLGGLLAIVGILVLKRSAPKKD